VAWIVSLDPTPRTNRPSEASWTVAAAMASVEAARVCRGTTPVARRIPRVAAANPVRVAKASRAAISGVKMASYPVSSAVSAMSSISCHGRTSRSIPSGPRWDSP
jgi:hypothetical protein